MFLTEIEECNLLKEFPNIKLSYETNVHKKVYSDFVLAIPDGKKYFAWFTNFKCQNVCILLEISENKKICKLEFAQCCFHNELSYGTIFYGSITKYQNIRVFCTEDIYYYKGKNVSLYSYDIKLDLFSQIYSSEIKQLSYFNNNIIFGLPIISNLFSTLVNNIELLPYTIKYIQFRKNDAVNRIENMVYSKDINSRYNNTSKKQEFKETVFIVKPDIQNDIYHLYYCDSMNNNEILYDTAYIPDYKTSVMMNKLFRNIKENENLDALEESDDEDEFENENIDKYVHLDRKYNMVCLYNAKFKKWFPYRLAKKDEKVIEKTDIFRLEKKNINI